MDHTDSGYILDIAVGIAAEWGWDGGSVSCSRLSLLS